VGNGKAAITGRFGGLEGASGKGTNRVLPQNKGLPLTGRKHCAGREKRWIETVRTGRVHPKRGAFWYGEKPPIETYRRLTHKTGLDFGKEAGHFDKGAVLRNSGGGSNVGGALEKISKKKKITPQRLGSEKRVHFSVGEKKLWGGKKTKNKKKP